MILKEQTRSFKVTFHTAAEVRKRPAVDILENRFLHKLFLLTHIPASWLGWQLAVGLLGMTLLVVVIWLPFGWVALPAAGIYALFALADWLLLWWLPRSGRSFGPVGPQLIMMTLPRVGAAVVTVLLALGFGQAFGLRTLLIFQLFGSFVYLWGMLHEPFALGITSLTLRSLQWPQNAETLRLLHLSDLHVERLTQREAQLLELVEQTKPDLIVITGDYLNLSYVNDPTARTEVRKVLAKLSAPYGVYATLGSPTVDPRDTTPSLFAGLNIRLLRDEVAVLDFGDGRTLSLLGMDCEHDLETDASVLRNLIALTPPTSTRILLYHSPELMPMAQEHPLDLYLCGHTHGGQIRVPLYGAIVTSSALGKRYEMGPYVEKDTMLYISRGIGLEGLGAPRLRLLCQPEVILVTLSSN